MCCGASCSCPLRLYDVFLSFYGKDTRRNFTDHLFHALKQNGIRTFRDDEELDKGEDIFRQLKAAIENSKIAIIVFSQNYAYSTSCLRELKWIMDCKESGKIKKVLPVFHKVDPTDIRNQKNNYEKAFVGHEERFKDETEKKMVQAWRDALTKVADLAGWHEENWYETKIITCIVEELEELLRLHMWDFQFRYHKEQLDHLQKISPKKIKKDHMQKVGRSDVVRIIGTYVLVELVKRLAVVVFRYISESFEVCTFIYNVGELSEKEGFAFIQEQLLSNILKSTVKINNEYEGIYIIKDCLSCKRVLINVLDNVEQMEQFDKLVGDHGSLVLGSLIMLTMHDLIQEILGREIVHEVSPKKPGGGRTRMWDYLEALDVWKSSLIFLSLQVLIMSSTLMRMRFESDFPSKESNSWKILTPVCHPVDYGMEM